MKLRAPNGSLGALGALVALAMLAACGGGASDDSASGTIDGASWSFGAGIYTVDALTPAHLQVIVSRNASFGCHATGESGSGESALLFLLPADPTQLAATTSGEATADYDDANADSATMTVTYTDLALGSDGALTGSLDATDADGDSVSGGFHASSCGSN